MMKSSSTNNNIIKYNKEREDEKHSWPSEPKMYFRLYTIIGCIYQM